MEYTVYLNTLFDLLCPKNCLPDINVLIADQSNRALFHRNGFENRVIKLRFGRLDCRIGTRYSEMPLQPDSKLLHINIIDW